MQLDQLLIQLAGMTDLVCARWVREQRAQDDEFLFNADADPFWFALEMSIYGWQCGFKTQPDEVTLWAIDVRGDTPTEAARALLAKISQPPTPNT